MIQSTCENACVRDLRECNRIIKYAICTSTRGLCFSPAFSCHDAVVVTISDASFCQKKKEQVDGIIKNFKSQQACTPLAKIISYSNFLFGLSAAELIRFPIPIRFEPRIK